MTKWVSVGYTSFKQLTFVLLPVLFAALGIAVATTRHIQHTQVDKWILNIGLHSPVQSWHLLALFSIGICLATLNLSVLDILKSKSCIDPLIQTTVAAVKTDHAFQWTWIFLVLLGNTAFGVMTWDLQKHCTQKAARSTQRWLRTLSRQVDEAAMQHRAVMAWRDNQPTGSKQVTRPCRAMLCWFLHIPAIGLGMWPACAYVSDQVIAARMTDNFGLQVLASNAPSGSGWQYTLFDNSLVVTCVQMAFNQLVAPRLVAILAQIKFGINRSTDLTVEYVIDVYHSQASFSMFHAFCV